MKVIGFGHRSGHGKDTCGKFLDTHLKIKCPKLRVKRINFANKLKDITYQLYGWTGVKRAVHYDNNREDRSIIIPTLGMTVVDLWVAVGEKLRMVFPETWLRYVTETDHQADIVIVCDVRHPNEANAIVEEHKADDWRLYKVLNPRVAPRESIPGALSIDHMLEGYDKWHDTFTNDAGMEEISNKMNALSDILIQDWGLKRG